MKKIAVVGNANAGKSTLVNTLTGSDLKVGNWHGVTVKREDRSYFYNGEEYVLSDLPGVYTVKSGIAEEGETAKALLSENYDAILFVAEAKTLPRAVALLGELKSFNLPVVVFINLYADFLKKNGKIDKEKLQTITGTEFFFGEANDKKIGEKFKEFFRLALLNEGNKIREFTSEDFKGVYSPATSRRKTDTVFLNSAPVYITFVIFVFLSVYLSFGEYGVGNIISGLIGGFTERVSSFTGEFLKKYCSPFVADMISDGLIGGVGAVAEFLPQITFMSLCLEFAEQSGFLSRLAVVSDGLLNKFGLSGKAVYALLVGFGCGAIAAASSAGIEDDGVKKRAVLSLPFVSCSAKTPVYAFVAKYCFKRYAFLVIVLIYFSSVALSLFNSALLYKTVLKQPPSPLIIELADMRFPKIKSMLSRTVKTVKNFAERLGTVIVISSLALFVLSRVTVDFRYVPTGSENSFIAYVGRAISPLFKPMGIKDWRYSVAAVTGIFAKEGIVSSLAALFPDGLTLAFSEGLAFVAFCYAYTPCVTALFSTAQAVGKVRTVVFAFLQLLYAFALSYSVYFISSVL